MVTLVTGASGFIGSAVVRKLLAEGHNVRVLIRPDADHRNLAGLAVERVEGDLRDPAARQRAVHGCTGLFHLAADYRLLVTDPAPMYATNVDSTRALLREAGDAGVRRIVYTSSVATLGIKGDGTPGDETTPVTVADMKGHYKRSKYFAEAAIQELVAAEGLPIVSVNPSTPIGPRDVKPTPTGRIVVEAANGKMPAYVNTGLNVVHVDDVADGHLLAFNKGVVGQRYVLGGENLSLKEILHLIAGIVGRRPPNVELPVAAVLPLAYVVEGIARILPRWTPFVTVDGVKLSKKKMYFSSAKAAAELGYEARPAKEAVADAIAWFRAEGYLT